MTTLLLTIFLALWASAAVLAVSLCVVAGRSERTPQRGMLRLVSSR